MNITLYDIYGKKKISGEYVSLKDLCEKNKEDLGFTNLRGAFLSMANLRYSDLSGSDLTGSHLNGVSFVGSDMSHADFTVSVMIGADLKDSDIRGCNFGHANMKGVDFTDANLDYIKNYYDNHYICHELISRQKLSSFTDLEWSMIGQVFAYSLCWRAIKKRYGRPFLRIFEVLRDAGWGEYYDKYIKILEEGKR